MAMRMIGTGEADYDYGFRLLGGGIHYYRRESDGGSWERIDRAGIPNPYQTRAERITRCEACGRWHPATVMVPVSTDGYEGCRDCYAADESL